MTSFAFITFNTFLANSLYRHLKHLFKNKRNRSNQLFIFNVNTQQQYNNNMVSKSILTSVTHCVIKDKSNDKENCDNNNNSNQTKSLSSGTVGESNPSLELVEVRDVIQQHNKKKKTKSKLINKTTFKSSQPKHILSSKENVLPTLINEPTTSNLSQVWQYAVRVPDSNYSTCSLCPDNKQISTNNGSTSTLRKHLITKHNIKELELPDTKRKSTSSLISSKRKQELHELFVDCIIRDGRTFNNFQKPGMKKLLQELIPGYEAPSRYTVVRRLKRLHLYHQKKLIDDLKFVDHISITLDFWSNRQMKSFLVITGHYFDINNFNLQSTVLNFSTFDKQHKSNEITQILQAKLKELNILHKVVRVTADGARNMVRGIEDLNLDLERVWCIAHRLHLVITNAFGFWIVKKESIEENLTVEEEQEVVNDGLNNQEEEMVDIEELRSNDELDDTDMDLTNDVELDCNELMEGDPLADEEVLWDIVDEEIMDNWTADVNASSANIIHDQDMILCLIKKCRGLILMIKRSTNITLFFDKERKKLNIKRNLCYDVKTRWNSTYAMIDSFLALREIIEKLFNCKHNLHILSKQLKKLTDLELSIDDWILLTTLHSILKPFFHATQVMSGREYPSIGLAFYLLMRLKSFLQKQDKKENMMIKRLKQLLLSQFVYYFENDNEQLQLLKFHAYFDPAGFATLTDPEKRTIEQNITNVIVDESSCSAELLTSTLPISSTTTNSVNKTNLEKHTNKNIIDVFNECVGEFNYQETRRHENKKATVIDDIHNYRRCVNQFNLVHKPDGTKSIFFWETQGQKFPILAKLAKKMLSTPATSVPSESCFSIASFLARKERTRLTGENLSSSVFLKDKIKL